MRYLIFIFLAIEPVISIQAQSPTGVPPKGGFDDNCVYRNKYTESERLKFYPFNVADTIKLISFRYHDNNYPVNKEYIATDSLVEEKTLSKEEVALLTDILYNNVPKRPDNSHSFLDCFEPRNAVLFIDKSGKLKEYMLICFHCRRFESSSSEKFGEWDTCNQKSEMIRKLFVSAGVKFGTDLSISNYPGECDVCR
jgi:hypothetical protein